MRLTPAGVFLQTESVVKPTLVVITTSEAFHRMAEGSYSPVEAYLCGAMTLLGNVELARKIIVHLAGSGAQTNVCPVGPNAPIKIFPTLINESWALGGGIGVGSLTVSGEFFTPGGTVNIHYDWEGAYINGLL